MMHASAPGNDEAIDAADLVESELDLDDEPYEEVIVIDLRGFTAEELSFN